MDHPPRRFRRFRVIGPHFRARGRRSSFQGASRAEARAPRRCRRRGPEGIQRGSSGPSESAKGRSRRGPAAARIRDGRLRREPPVVVHVQRGGGRVRARERGALAAAARGGAAEARGSGAGQRGKRPGARVERSAASVQDPVPDRLRSEETRQAVARVFRQRLSFAFLPRSAVVKRG